MSKHIHFLGIAGSGASAAAAIAQSQGFEVTGCDLNPHNEFTVVFKPHQLLKGHSASHLTSGKSGNVKILVVTPAIFSLDPNNPELLAAGERNIPIMTWQQFVGEYLAKNKFVIAVCGTHGKTTTTAMIAKILEDANLDPTVLLGAIMPKWKTNYRLGSGQYLVIEADEFNDNFLSYKPNMSVVTNIEMDHPEYFKDFNAYKESFGKFLEQTKEKIIANQEDPGVNKVLAFHLGGGNSVIDYSKQLIDFPLKIPGQFNILNASAVYQVGLALEIDPEIIKKSLMNFSGIGRRFEKVGEYRRTQVFTDFAHHPTEIKVTIEAAREKFPDKNLVVVFQPHMFSRTKALFADFVKVLSNLLVEKIYILDIYPSREVDTGLVNSKQLVEAINKDNVLYVNSKEQVLEKLKQKADRDKVFFFVGAGDINQLAKKLAS